MLNGKGFFQPGVDTAGKGTNPRYPHTLKEQRRTGAPNLTGSVAAQNDITVTGNLMMVLLDLFKRGRQGPRDDKRVRREFEGSFILTHLTGGSFSLKSRHILELSDGNLLSLPGRHPLRLDQIVNPLLR